MQGNNYLVGNLCKAFHKHILPMIGNILISIVRKGVETEGASSLAEHSLNNVSIQVPPISADLVSVVSVIVDGILVTGLTPDEKKGIGEHHPLVGRISLPGCTEIRIVGLTV